MQKTLVEEKLQKVASFNGIEIYHIKAGKFKTNTINIFFNDILTKDHASKNAIIPAVLRRGCERLPSFQEIALYLEEIYGASFDCGVTKKGERQIIQFYIEHVSDRYTSEKACLFEKAFDLLYEIITKPVLDNGAFKREYVEQEKENLKRLIDSRVNDKVQYAVEKCLEEMCKDEPFGIYEYGASGDIDNINEKELYEYYGHFLKSLPMHVYITGEIEEDKLKYAIQKLSQIQRAEIKKAEGSFTVRAVGKVNHFTEKMNVNQGKLSLGFRTNTPPDSKDYYTLLVYNGILGGGIHSKLFQNVREKASLAYYAFSRLEKFKGLMVISSGIEIQNKDKALDIIMRQLEEIKSGNISDYEYQSTLNTIENGMKSLRDNQISVVDFYLSQSIANTEDEFNSIIQKVKEVSKQDIIKLSGKIDLDTVYFLAANS